MSDNGQQLNSQVADDLEQSETIEQAVPSEETVEQTIPGDETATDNPKRKKLNKVIDVLLWVLIALLALSLIVRIFFVTQITVKGESMMETLHDGQNVTVSKVKRINRGDIVVFYEHDGANKFLDVFNSDKYVKLIKRVVAVEGDKLWIEKTDDNSNKYKVIIESAEGETFYENEYKHDGEFLSAQTFYINNTLSDLGILSEHIGHDNALVISDDCFFAMGDNRGNSRDSRVFGEVEMKRLYGVVIN